MPRCKNDRRLVEFAESMLAREMPREKPTAFWASYLPLLRERIEAKEARAFAPRFASVLAAAAIVVVLALGVSHDKQNGTSSASTADTSQIIVPEYALHLGADAYAEVASGEHDVSLPTMEGDAVELVDACEAFAAPGGSDVMGELESLSDEEFEAVARAILRPSA